jgi:hypothetical protein
MISHRTPRPPTPLQCVASLVSQGAQIASIIHSPPFVLIQERAGPRHRGSGPPDGNPISAVR